MTMVFCPKKLHTASSAPKMVILQFLLDMRSIFDADSIQMRLTADDAAEFDLRPSFILQSMVMRWTEKMMTTRKKQYMAQFIAVILTASFLKQDNNQDVLRLWDGGGHGGPLEHGGGQLGLTLVSRQQEGGSLYRVLWCLHYIIISSWEKILVSSVWQGPGTEKKLWRHTIWGTNEIVSRRWELYKCVVVVCVVWGVCVCVLDRLVGTKFAGRIRR